MKRLLIFMIATTILAVSCADPYGDPDTDNAVSTSTPTTSSPRTSPAQFTAADCAMPVPIDRKVTCGTVEVPENRTKPDGRKIELAVAIIESSAAAADKRPDPVVYLHGGPGSGRLARGFEKIGSNPLLANRDLIYFDQRGVGLSTPSLNCPERETAFIDALKTPAPYTDEVEAIATSLATCHDRLVDDGIDLSQYNTVTNAADLADLRIALGYDEWNVWGISYGTRLALEAMRSQPDGIRSVIIDSIYPPSAGSADESVRSGERAFDALAAGCAADATCDIANPDVRGTLERAAMALDRQPYQFDYTAPDGAITPLALTGNDLVGGLFNALYDTTLIPLLPSAITGLAAGDRSIVPLIADDGIPFVNDATEGAFLSYECADNSARLDTDQVAELRADAGRAGLLLLAGWQLFCAEWPVDPLPASFGDTVTSPIPTLVIAGEYDPITPPAGTKAVADALDDAVFVQAPRGGHGPGLDFDCTSGIMTSFLDDLTKVDTGCVATLPPLPFSG